MDNKIDSCTQDELANIDNIEIEPLADEDLESVVGGFCSWSGCSNGTVKPQAQ